MSFHPLAGLRNIREMQLETRILVVAGNRREFEAWRKRSNRSRDEAIPITSYGDARAAGLRYKAYRHISVVRLPGSKQLPLVERQRIMHEFRARQFIAE